MLWLVQFLEAPDKPTSSIFHMTGGRRIRKISFVVPDIRPVGVPLDDATRPWWVTTATNRIIRVCNDKFITFWCFYLYGLGCGICGRGM